MDTATAVAVGTVLAAIIYAAIALVNSHGDKKNLLQEIKHVREEMATNQKFLTDRISELKEELKGYSDTRDKVIKHAEKIESLQKDVDQLKQDVENLKVNHQ